MRHTRTIPTEDGGEEELPAKWVICETCRGEGTRVNPAIDGHGLSPDDPDLDEEFWDNYWGGVYDIKCDACEGTGKVLTVDEAHCSPGQVAAWHEYLRDEAEYRAMCAAERRAGC